MAFRRSARRSAPRRFKRRRAPLRTTSIKETRWNTSRFHAVRQFIFDFESVQNVDMVVFNPKVMLEMQLQPTTPIGGPVTNIAPIINTLNAVRGVKIGGIVWDSGFHCQTPTRSDDGETFTIAYSEVTETLWTREVDDEGIAQEVPLMQDTWRPLRVDDSVFDPGENDGDLVRIHHTRTSLIACGDNAYGWIGIGADSSVGQAAAAASTWTQPTWGGTRSLRLRKFLADDQTLNFNLVVDNPNPSAQNQVSITWLCNATVYWAMQNQR